MKRRCLHPWELWAKGPEQIAVREAMPAVYAMPELQLLPEIARVEQTQEVFAHPSAIPHKLPAPPAIPPYLQIVLLAEFPELVARQALHLSTALIEASALNKRIAVCYPCAAYYCLLDAQMLFSAGV